MLVKQTFLTFLPGFGDTYMFHLVTVEVNKLSFECKFLMMQVNLKYGMLFV